MRRTSDDCVILSSSLVPAASDLQALVFVDARFVSRSQQRRGSEREPYRECFLIIEHNESLCCTIDKYTEISETAEAHSSGRCCFMITVIWIQWEQRQVWLRDGCFYEITRAINQHVKDKHHALLRNSRARVTGKYSVLTSHNQNIVKYCIQITGWSEKHEQIWFLTNDKRGSVWAQRCHSSTHSQSEISSFA